MTVLMWHECKWKLQYAEGMDVNIIRMSGGLGNQMFQYALYMKLKAMGKEIKFDDINEYRGDNAKPIMLSVFGIQIPRATWDEINAFTDGSMELTQRIRRKFTGRRAIEYTEEGFYDPKVLTFDSMYLRGSFQSERYFEDIVGEVRKAYQFPALEDMHLPDKLYQGTVECLKQIENTLSVSLHMRRSDSRPDEELYEGICTEQYYEGAVRFIQERYPDAVFYIFSNEPKWVKNWVDNLIESQMKEGMTKQEKSALQEKFVMVEANTEYTAYLDMQLVTRCRHNIISNSSFSWWGAWLNDNPDKIVIAPDRWKNNVESDEIYTKGMVLINAKGRVNRTVK